MRKILEGAVYTPPLFCASQTFASPVTKSKTPHRPAERLFMQKFTSLSYKRNRTTLVVLLAGRTVLIISYPYISSRSTGFPV